MVQVLPYVPSFGERLTPILTDALGKVAQGYGSRQRKRADQSIIGSLQDGNLSPVEINKAYAGLSEEGRKSVEPFVNSQLRIHEAEEKQKIKTASEEQVANKEKQGRASELQTTLGTLAKDVEKNLPGIGVSPTTAIGLNRQGVQNRSRFNSYRAKIESILLPMVNKGTLAKERFSFILSFVPNASDSQREIVGKLEGLAGALSQDGFPINTDFLKGISFAQDPQSDVYTRGKEQEGQEQKPMDLSQIWGS